MARSLKQSATLRTENENTKERLRQRVNLSNVHSACYNVGMFMFQLRQTYPEDTFLIPGIFFGFILWGLLILLALAVSLYFSIYRRRIRQSAKNDGDIKVSESSGQYYMKLGDHEIDVQPDELNRLRREGYTIYER